MSVQLLLVDLSVLVGINRRLTNRNRLVETGARLSNTKAF